MKSLNPVTHQTPDEIDELIKEREAVAAMLPPGMTRQSVLVDVARLRSYAELKRWLAESTKPS
jgi:hypothetical protein